MKTLYKNCTLIDGTGNEPINTSFTVEDGRIIEIGDNLKADKEIDLDGKYIMPGLINSHVHITMEPIGDPFVLIMNESDAKAAIRGVKNLKKQLKSGTTYFRDLGASNGVDIDLRNAVNEGLIEGAEFKCAGSVVTMTGGHGWPIGREADGVDETRKAAREQLKKGSDLVKIMATGGVMTTGVEPGSPQLSMEEMKAAVEEAHKAGKKTASHAQGTQGIKNAILAGIDSIEHGLILDEEAVDMMYENNTYLVPTLVAPYVIVEKGVEAGIKKDSYEKAVSTMESHIKSFKMSYEKGVKIAMGTDAGTPFNTHDMAWMELKLMIEYGMKPMDAIVSSTRNSAELLDILDDYGTIEKGKFADFLILDENPLENIETLSKINTVYKKGVKVK
ncbi:MAG: amidohydrolase family protein [Tissierellia bacterium]|nr:amidohydrolase family protein [Tissierellia bacterium]